MHDARAVANWLINKALKVGKPLTPLQVIKLVYFAYGWTLAFYDRRLFQQPVEAWQYGPVITDVYHALKQYRASTIDHKIPGVPEPDFSTDEIDVLEQVYDVYGHLSGIQLSTMTHHPNSPWDKTRRGRQIKDKVIRRHFLELASE